MILWSLNTTALGYGNVSHKWDWEGRWGSRRDDVRKTKINQEKKVAKQKEIKKSPLDSENSCEVLLSQNIDHFYLIWMNREDTFMKKIVNSTVEVVKQNTSLLRRQSAWFKQEWSRHPMGPRFKFYTSINSQVLNWSET